MLIGSIKLVCDQPNIESIVGLIKQELDVRPEHVDAIFETLEGWWFSRVISHLMAASTEQITRLELRMKFNDIRDQYAADNLPITFAGIDPPPGYDVQQATFVKQLDAIAPDSGRVQQAIRDYYRAVEQRSQWARYDLLGLKELQTYEKRLVEAWELQRSILRDELPRWADTELEMQLFGRKLLLWIETQVNFPIRPRVNEAYVTRGSYHILSQWSKVTQQGDRIEGHEQTNRLPSQPRATHRA